MTDSVSPFDKQIANRNYMSPVGFKLILTKTPKVDFLCQKLAIVYYGPTRSWVPFPSVCFRNDAKFQKKVFGRQKNRH